MIAGGHRIGVLGGIGPEATGEFYNKLIGKLQRMGIVNTNSDFPQIIINSIPAPELIYDDILDDDLQVYIAGLKELSLLNPDFIVMVCNTIHLYHSELQKEIRIPIIDLRTELEQFLITHRIESALIIGTPAVIRKGLYKFNGIKSIEPEETEIQQLSVAIHNFNRGAGKSNEIKNVKKICEKYLRMGAETVILGCTEFGVMLGKEKFSKINTIDVLVDSTIKRLFNHLTTYPKP